MERVGIFAWDVRKVLTGRSKMSKKKGSKNKFVGRGENKKVGR